MQKRVLFAVLLAGVPAAVRSQMVFDWVQLIPTPLAQVADQVPDAKVIDMTTTADGSTYLAGMFIKKIVFTPTLSPTSTFPSSSLFLARYDADGEVAWLKVVTGITGIDPGSVDFAYSLGVAADTLGHVYLAGELPNMTLDLGDGVVTHRQCASSCSDVFIARFDAGTGQAQWARTIAGESFTHTGIAGIVAEPDGDFFVGGDYGGETLDLGQDSIYSGLEPGSLYLAKFNTDGAPLWARFPVGQTTETYVLVRAPGGDVYLNGFYATALDLGHGVTLEIQPDAATQWHFYIAQYDADGLPLAAYNVNSRDYANIFDMAIDGQDRMYLAVDFDDEVRSFDEPIVTNPSNLHGNALLRFDGTTWSVVKKFDYTVNSIVLPCHSIAIDADDNVYTGGYYDNTTMGVPGDFGGGLYDFVLMRSLPSGEVDWVYRAGGSGSEGVYNGYYGKSIATDSAGKVYVTGVYSQGLKLDEVYASGGIGLYAARLNPDAISATRPAAAEGLAITLTPNPTDGAFRLTCADEQLPGLAVLRTIDGRELLRRPVTEPETAFALRLPAGVYTLEFLNARGTGVQRLVVR
jgi:hypothetical protein